MASLCQFVNRDGYCKNRGTCTWRHPPPCKSDHKCFKFDCTFLHTVPRCPQFTNCSDPNCKNNMRHGPCHEVEQAGWCANGKARCKFYHPPDCKNDAKCQVPDCKFDHSVAKCPQKVCQTPNCKLRHRVPLATTAVAPPAAVVGVVDKLFETVGWIDCPSSPFGAIQVQFARTAAPAAKLQMKVECYPVKTVIDGNTQYVSERVILANAPDVEGPIASSRNVAVLIVDGGYFWANRKPPQFRMPIDFLKMRTFLLRYTQAADIKTFYYNSDPNQWVTFKQKTKEGIEEEQRKQMIAFHTFLMHHNVNVSAKYGFKEQKIWTPGGKREAGQPAKGYVQCGVDCAIASVIVDKAHSPEVTDILLFSGDSDLVEPLKIAQGYNKKVWVVGFENSVSSELKNLTQEDSTYIDLLKHQVSIAVEFAKKPAVAHPGKPGAAAVGGGGGGVKPPWGKSPHNDRNIALPESSSGAGPTGSCVATSSAMVRDRNDPKEADPVIFDPTQFADDLEQPSDDFAALPPDRQECLNLLVGMLVALGYDCHDTTKLKQLALGNPNSTASQLLNGALDLFD